MTTEQKISPRNTWKDLSVTQLYAVKSDMTDLYYGMRGANASFAQQYLTFLNELDALISRKTSEAEKDQD